MRGTSFRVALVVASSIFCAAFWLTPGEAHAQYKNNSFGLDVGGWLISKPSILDDDGNIKPQDQRPTRLANGLRLGGEVNVKMSEDHWWFTGRVNVGFLRYGGSATGDVAQQFDASAGEALGTLLGVQGSIGVRYIILTDRFRPYIQTSLSFMHLFSFTSAADEECSSSSYTSLFGSDFCTDDDDTNTDAFMPHNDLGGFHIQPGVEIIFTRDTAFHIFADMQHWIVFNAEDNNAMVLGLGFIFFT